MVERKAVLCITAILATRLPQRVSLDHPSRRRKVIYVGSAPNSVKVFCAVANGGQCHKRTNAVQQTPYTGAVIHSITLSARPSSVMGKVMPSALAVLRLMISSTLLTC